ncbi:hypothetical protein B484DRAFT_394224 [Ochromonadaceae sp. CCMP2298]|nr:hypothetical protein B484DRAFT_394224 [Ochromonadaceae sp. CCMP2298]
MEYDQAVAILAYEVSMSSRRCQSLGMTMKIGATGRPALFRKQCYSTVSDYTQEADEDGSYPIVECFAGPKGSIKVTTKIYSEVWLPKIHDVIAEFEAPARDEYADAEVSDKKLEAWAYKLDVLDPLQALGITAISVKALLLSTPSKGYKAAERTMKLTLIDLLHSVHCVYARPAKNDADTTWRQRDITGKKRKLSTQDKQANLTTVRKMTSEAREGQRVIDLDSEDKGPGVVIKTEDGAPRTGSKGPSKDGPPSGKKQRSKGSSSVLDNGMGAVKDPTLAMQKKDAGESKLCDLQLLRETGLTSPDLLLDDDFCKRLTGHLKNFPAKAFTTAFASFADLQAADVKFLPSIAVATQ